MSIYEDGGLTRTRERSGSNGAHLSPLGQASKEGDARDRQGRSGLTILLAVGYPDDMFVVSYRMFQVFHSLTRVSPHTFERCEAA
jgi:hypothetical protein